MQVSENKDKKIYSGQVVSDKMDKTIVVKTSPYSISIQFFKKLFVLLKSTKCTMSKGLQKLVMSSNFMKADIFQKPNICIWLALFNLNLVKVHRVII